MQMVNIAGEGCWFAAKSPHLWLFYGPMMWMFFIMTILVLGTFSKGMGQYTKITTIYLLRHFSGLCIVTFIFVSAFIYDIVLPNTDIVFFQVTRFLGYSLVGICAFVAFGITDYHIKAWTKYLKNLGHKNSAYTSS